MEYDSDNIKDMISTLKKYGYEYTEYNHRNGKSTIDTNILLEIMKKQVEEEGMRLVKLFSDIPHFASIEKLIYTNASDLVIENICEDIKKDGLLDDENKINGVLDVLKARGYKYKTVDNIHQFGF